MTRITVGALHHVIIRGIERSAIFKHEGDREEFLRRPGTLLQEASTSCYAWALMNNHAHLLLRSGLPPLSSFMRRLLTAYSPAVTLAAAEDGIFTLSGVVDLAGYGS